MERFTSSEVMKRYTYADISTARAQRIRLCLERVKGPGKARFMVGRDVSGRNVVPRDAHHDKKEMDITHVGGAD